MTNLIQAEALGKQYTIGHQTENGRYVALRDVNAKLSPFAICHLPFEGVCALKDVNFEIRRGEAVGGPKALSGATARAKARCCADATLGPRCSAASPSRAPGG